MFHYSRRPVTSLHVTSCTKPFPVLELQACCVRRPGCKCTQWLCHGLHHSDLTIDLLHLHHFCMAFPYTKTCVGVQCPTGSNAEFAIEAGDSRYTVTVILKMTMSAAVGLCIWQMSYLEIVLVLPSYCSSSCILHSYYNTQLRQYIIANSVLC